MRLLARQHLRQAAAMLTLCSAAWAALPASAQIFIGQTSGFTGVVADGVKENTAGARLLIDHVNARGGVNGQLIELISLDDKFEVSLAKKNAEELVTRRNVVAMFLNRGTPHTEAILPILSQHKVPLVAPSTGAMLFHKPVHPLVFNVRASYQREGERVVQHLDLVGVSRIAVLHVDDSFGADGAAGVDKGFKSVGKSPVFLEKFDRARPDLAGILPRLLKTEPQTLVFIGSSEVVAEGVKALRAAGSRAQVVTLSNNASEGFIKQLGEQGHGVIVSQVFPNERLVSVLVVKEAMELARAKGLPGVSPATMEGFAGAKVLVEGLRRAGRNPTRASLTAALNGMRHFDLGGMEVSFSPDDHSGLDFVDLSILDTNGKFRR